MKRRHKKGDKGFSLIEVIISMTILAFGLIGIFSLFSRGVGDIDYGKRKTRATNLALDKMEELRAVAFSKTHVDTQLTAGFVHSDSVTVDDVLYKRRWTVKDSVFDPDTSDPVLKIIRVNVDWRGRNANKQTYSISTKRRRY